MATGRTYKNNFLNNVIVRADFLTSFIEFETEVSVEIAKMIAKLFPIAEPQDIIGHEVKMENDIVENTKFIEKHWNYFSKNRDKKLTITKECFIIEFFKYDSYNTFIEHFNLVCNLINENYPDTQYSRIGLRYINKISLQENNIFSWSKYINKKALTLFYLRISQKCLGFSVLLSKTLMIICLSYN